MEVLYDARISESQSFLHKTLRKIVDLETSILRLKKPLVTTGAD